MELINLTSTYVDEYLWDHALTKYYEPHRYHHGWFHIQYMVDKMVEKNMQSELLALAILFHDIIYDPRSNDNEVKSAEYARNELSHTFPGNTPMSKNDIDAICNAILDTKTHIPTSKLGEQLCELDLSILNESLTDLIRYEDDIFKEYQFIDWKIYRENRIKFLQDIQLNKYVLHYNKLNELISYINGKVPNIAVYAGSFNPFHKGHLNILNKAERVFDKVIIAQGLNPEKSPAKLLMSCETGGVLYYHQVEKYDGLLTDFIKSLEYKVTLVRGLRNTTDLQAELNQYRYLKELMPELEMVSFYCDAEFEHISSSGIRQLSGYRTDLPSKYIVK